MIFYNRRASAYSFLAHKKKVPNQWTALKLAFKFCSDHISLDKQDGN